MKKQNDRFPKPKLGDFVIVILILASAFFLWKGFFCGSQGTTATISQDGTEIAILDLQGNLQTMELDNGMIVEYGNGGVQMIESNCPDHVCVRTGRITSKGQSIVCVPNHVIITIEGEAEIDAISG